MSIEELPAGTRDKHDEIRARIDLIEDSLSDAGIELFSKYHFAFEHCGRVEVALRVDADGMSVSSERDIPLIGR